MLTATILCLIGHINLLGWLGLACSALSLLWILWPALQPYPKARRKVSED